MRLRRGQEIIVEAMIVVAHCHAFSPVDRDLLQRLSSPSNSGPYFLSDRGQE